MRRSCGLGKKDSSHAGNGQFPPEVSASVSAGLPSSSDHGAAMFSENRIALDDDISNCHFKNSFLIYIKLYGFIST